jgi:hypothetical protein
MNEEVTGIHFFEIDYDLVPQYYLKGRMNSDK